MPSSRASTDDCATSCSTRRIFTSLAHVREALAIWKDDYNTVRPHSALGNLPPAVFAELSVPGMQRDGALRYVEGSAPRPVAPPSQQGLKKPRKEFPHRRMRSGAQRRH